MQIRYHFKDQKQEPIFFKSYADDKLEKLEKLPFKLSKVDVVTYKEGSFYTVELIVKGFKEVRAQATTYTLEDSIDRCIEKCLRQMTKVKLVHSKEQIRQKRKNRREVFEAASEAWGEKAA